MNTIPILIFAISLLSLIIIFRKSMQKKIDPSEVKDFKPLQFSHIAISVIAIVIIIFGLSTGDFGLLALTILVSIFLYALVFFYILDRTNLNVASKSIVQLVLYGVASLIVAGIVFVIWAFLVLMP